MEDISLIYERDGNAEEYIEAHIRNCPDLAQADHDGDTVFSHARRGLRDGLLRLHALPRTHPFWQGTNHRATIPKLEEYSRQRLQEDPRDTLSVWSLIGLAILTANDPLDRDLWQRLYDAGELNPAWLVQLAGWMEHEMVLRSGWKPETPTARTLAAWLKAWDRVEAARPTLAEWTKNGGEAARWARAVLRGCR